MATSVIRRYWVDLDDMRVTASLGDRNPIQEIRLKARDSARIGFQFHRGGVPELLAASTGITVGIKERNDFGGSYLASVTSFTAATTTNTVGFADTDFYYGQLDLNTTAIDDALGTSETSIDGMFEVQLDISGSGMRVSTETITCTILNDINQGGEGTPTSADPPYPSASEVFRWKPGVTSLTGGTSADLDSIATTSLTPPYAIAINNQDSSDLWEIWILTTGTDAEDPGNGIVRPDDYNGATNAKVWKRKQLFAAVNDESVAAAVSATNYTPSAAHVEGHLAGIDTKLGTLSAAAEIVSDTSPQLGGHLDTNAFSIDFDDNKGIRDDSGNEQLWFQKTASAVNYLEITNAATGNAPSIAAAGTDSNISLNLVSKGTGTVQAGGLPIIAVTGTPAQGDIIYRGASAWAYLSAGTSGHFLKTQGAGANPTWASASASRFEEIDLPANLWYPKTTAGCAALAQYESTTYDNNLKYLAFDGTSQEYASIVVKFPDDLDDTTAIKAKILWMPASSTGDVYWAAQLHKLSDGASPDSASTTSISTVVTGTSGTLDLTSAASFVANNGFAGLWVQIQLSRASTQPNDTLNGIDAWFFGMTLQVKRTGNASAW